jgi:transcriptional regulator with PAS, ATPase and Fis domain
MSPLVEIANLTLAFQSKSVRFIQNRHYYRAGGLAFVHASAHRADEL